jgi:transposase
MTTYAPFDRDQPFLLPPDLKDWLPEDDLAHFIVAAAERVRLGAFRTNRQAGGKPQYHPRLMVALLVYCYGNGVFSSRRIERATYRDIGARFIAANTHPDHDISPDQQGGVRGGISRSAVAGTREWVVEARHGVDRRDQD